MTEIILAWDGVVQAGQFPITTPLVLLVQIVTEAGIIDVLIHFGSHFQDDEARGIVAVATSGAIVGRTNRAGEAEVDGGADEPTEAAFDLTCTRQRDGARRELIVREPTTGGLGKGRGKRLQAVLIESVSVDPKRLKIKGRELLMGKRYDVLAQSSFSSPRGNSLEWNCYDASFWLIWHALARMGRQHGGKNSSTAYIVSKKPETPAY